MIEKEQIHILCETLAKTSTTLPTIEERKAYKQALDDVWKNVQNSKNDEKKIFYIIDYKVDNDTSTINVTEDINEAQKSFNEEVKRLKETEEYKQSDEEYITDNGSFFCFCNCDGRYYEVFLHKFINNK